MTPAANGTVAGERPGTPCLTDSDSDQSTVVEAQPARFGSGVFCCTVTEHDVPGDTHKSNFIIRHNDEATPLLRAFLRFGNGLANTFTVGLDSRADLFPTESHHIVEMYYYPCPNPPPDRPASELDDVRQQVFALTSVRDNSGVHTGLMEYDWIPWSLRHFSEAGGGTGTCSFANSPVYQVPYSDRYPDQKITGTA